MVRMKYDCRVTSHELNQYLGLLKNKVYKLLPLHEEKADWQGYLETVVAEVLGANVVFKGNSVQFVEVACRLEGLKFTQEFVQYRKTIFEVLAFIDKIEVVNNEIS